MFLLLLAISKVPCSCLMCSYTCSFYALYLRLTWCQEHLEHIVVEYMPHLHHYVLCHILIPSNICHIDHKWVTSLHISLWQFVGYCNCCLSADLVYHQHKNVFQPNTLWVVWKWSTNKIGYYWILWNSYMKSGQTAWTSEDVQSCAKAHGSLAYIQLRGVWSRDYVYGIVF